MLLDNQRSFLHADSRRNYYICEAGNGQSRKSVLFGNDLGELYSAVYNVTPGGNFEEMNLPNQIEADYAAIAEEHDLDENALKEKQRQKLLEVRKQPTNIEEISNNDYGIKHDATF